MAISARSRPDGLHHQAIQRAAAAEKAVILKLGTLPQMRNLRSFSFVRPASWNDDGDSMIQYQIRVVPSISHSRVDILSPDIASASTLYYEALPRPSANSRSWPKCSVKDWRSVALAYAQGNQVASVVAAGAGGLLLSEAGRALYIHATSS